MLRFCEVYGVHHILSDEYSLKRLECKYWPIQRQITLFIFLTSSVNVNEKNCSLANLDVNLHSTNQSQACCCLYSVIDISVCAH